MRGDVETGVGGVKKGRESCGRMHGVSVETVGKSVGVWGR